MFPAQVAFDLVSGARWSPRQRQPWLRRIVDDPAVTVEDRRRARLLLARAEEDAGDPAAARNCLLLGSDDPQTWPDLARLARVAGDTADARQWARRIVDDGSTTRHDTTTALRDLAALELDAGDLDAARRWFTRAAEHDPDGQARRDWARAEVRHGDLERARTLAASAAALPDPDAPDSITSTSDPLPDLRRAEPGVWHARVLLAAIDFLRQQDQQSARRALEDLQQGSPIRSRMHNGIDEIVAALVELRHPLTLKVLIGEPDIETADFDMLPSACHHECSGSRTVARGFYRDVIEEREVVIPEVAIGIACARLAEMNLWDDKESVHRCLARMRTSPHPGVRALEQEFSNKFDAALRDFR